MASVQKTAGVGQNIIKGGFLKNLVAAYKKFDYGAQHYCRYGLLHDDLLDDRWFPNVKEAIRRLPVDVQDERTYRLVRAVQLDITKSVLPKDEWVPFEDPNHRYLKSYIDEIERENREKLEWDARS